MRISARNQLHGSVVAVQRGAVNDEVTIALPGGQQIVSVVTHESVETLGLKAGSEAFALIKASSVILLEGDGTGLKLSARNQLPGTVSELKRGAVNSEISLDIGGGTVIVAIITNGSVERLGLAPGKHASALFKASSVMVGVHD
jgi:molybdate transport system regulatory protein